ncbi:hypothetical protein [Actinopolyspora saharensis]|uniref:Uncharacterized protein n=1 Tax=Actinopolyspora saharensis TaxID=995062 RepID=A0A1H1H0A2_9ACTN|nr:hypothetical protein [Actinopolyspora saharensis]SDR18538.1 hypothetical protein SAMN04489718_3995 [Actinopolyspora saharensis]
MTSSADAETEYETRLLQLIARGFQFVQSTDSDGELESIVGFRGHDNVIDVVRLESEDQVSATRMPSSEENIYAPSTVLWRSSGTVYQVIDQLLELPDDHTPGALLVTTSGTGS